MPRPWENISDWEFELVAGDLLGAVLQVQFERFARGPDLGIDRRHLRADGRPDVIQAKHYKGSSYSDLKRAVRKEAKRLPELDPQPASYRLVTSQPLTVRRKGELAKLLSPYIEREDHVFGRDDVEQLLDDHPSIERRHVKLWLVSGTQLNALLRPGTHLRSRALAQDIARTLPLYVQGESFFEARELLWKRRILLVAGPPGIGKTTLARMLIAEAIGEGYAPIEVGDAEEAWDSWDESEHQALVYDDFLGRTVLGELTKREESRLLSLMGSVAGSPNTLLVMTTREYILQQAAIAFEGFRRHGLPRERFYLFLDSYSNLDKAKILHNHVWHSDLPIKAKEQLATDRGYRRLVLHRNFNPRLIEFVTGLQRGHPLKLAPGDSWLDFAEAALDHPEEIWRQAFVEELGAAEQALLLSLATLPDLAHLDDMHRAFDAWCDETGVGARPDRFERALQIVADTFVDTLIREGGEVFARIINPGLADFLHRQLTAEPQLAVAGLRASIFIEQVQTILRLLTDAPAVTRHVIRNGTELAEAVDRLMDQQGSRWAVHRFGGGTEQMRRVVATPDGRLPWLVRTASAPDAPTSLREVAERWLIARADRWRRCEGDATAALAIAEELSGDDVLAGPKSWREALKALLNEDPYSAELWDNLLDLAELFPDLFDDNDYADMRERYSRFAEEDLMDRIYDFEDESEIDALEAVAERLGITLDEDHVKRAREHATEHAQAQDYIDDMRAEDERLYWLQEGRPARMQEERAMDALFPPPDE